VFIVYFFLPETNNKTLEEIDTMFLLEVSPLKSSKWEPPRGDELITADKLMLNKGASRIDKRTKAQQPGTQHSESVSGRPHAEQMRGTSEGSDPRQLLGSGVRGDSFVGRGSGPIRYST
jgi:MFS transporter, SP family, sugar:H+ symporter